MGAINGGARNIVTNGLVLNLDAGNYKSYPGSGTTWTDLSGNGNNGTLTNGPTFTPANGGSIVFDGTNDYVDLPINTAFNTPSVTFDIWVNLQSVGSRHILMLNWQGLSLEVNSDKTVSMYNYSSGGQLAAGGSGVEWLNWIHFSGMYDDNAQQLRIYVNGSLSGTRSSTSSTIYSVDVHKIAGIDYSLGILGNVAIARHYNRALSATEVLQNFNSSRARFGI